MNKYNEGELIYCRFHDIVYKYINNESKKIVEYYNRLNPHILYDIIRKNKNFTINRERLVDLNKFQFILFYEYYAFFIHILVVY